MQCSVRKIMITTSICELANDIYLVDMVGGMYDSKVVFRTEATESEVT